ncbi:MAG: polyribonucleotide nucleotidyltransferase, partial [Pseudomonadota bacterium]
MFKEVIKEINWGGKTLTMKTGKVARQSDGAVMISMGETVVLCTAVSARQVKEGIGFFPLTVHYREMAFAAGKIPGGFFKREGRSSDREILVCRLIDRPIRPLFHPSFFNETQIICTVLSYDPACNPDILSIIGSSAALALSGAPYMHTIAAARVGHIDGNFVLNPTFDEAKKSRLDLVVAGTDSSVMMVESEADQLSEEEMLAAVAFGHDALRPVVKMIEELSSEAGKQKWELPTPIASEELINEIEAGYSSKITEAFSIKLKQTRVHALNMIHQSIKEQYVDREDITKLQIEIALDEVKAKVLRTEVLKSGVRIDGRKTTDIRSIDCETSILPKTHGSALFTRGETQGMVVATLGTTQDEQVVDNISGDTRDRFMLQYIFPPYSVGEATPLRAPGRREVGHGKLAWRALNPVMPTKEEFPYSLRIVSEITESNGSSSMATVCGGSLAMMDAGVPLKAPVSGIAMGLIKEGEKFVILSDILGDEDYLGDMDFKVAGTSNGITALQMDIKVTGITIEIMKQALSQARDGRIHILECMSKALTSHRTEVNQYAPIIKSFKVNKDKIREIIGPGGKVIKDICERTGAKIDINDDGKVEVSAIGAENLNAAVAMIMAIAAEPEIGQIFDGTVVKVLESGAFINYMPGRDGFIHISEISDERIDDINSHLILDKVVKVKIIGVDPKGKAKLSMRIEATHHAEPPRRERSDSERSGGERSGRSRSGGGERNENQRDSGDRSADRD